MKKTLLSWSTGKDSAWALHVLRQDPQIQVLGLFTVVDETRGRVPMHATRSEVLHRQADAVGLPLQIINLPDPCTTEQSDSIMQQFVQTAACQGIECMAFGDLFLEDIRAYREKQLAGTGIQPIFPLWGISTRALAEQMLSARLEAYVSSVDLKVLPARFVGKKWSTDMLTQLPEGCDPCGENGEIHTVVVDGPMFHDSIPVKIGGVVERNGFAYADIVLEN
jgi:uncharacterized protein (TIGR00290 family)